MGATNVWQYFAYMLVWVPQMCISICVIVLLLHVCVMLQHMVVAQQRAADVKGKRR